MSTSKLKLFPWERGGKPYFVNEEGFEWYVDMKTTMYAKESDIDDLVAFFVKKGDMIERAIINNKKEVLFSSQSLEKMLAYIDKIKIVKQFVNK